MEMETITKDNTLMGFHRDLVNMNGVMVVLTRVTLSKG